MITSQIELSEWITESCYSLYGHSLGQVNLIDLWQGALDYLFVFLVLLVAKSFFSWVTNFDLSGFAACVILYWDKVNG